MVLQDGRGVERHRACLRTRGIADLQLELASATRFRPAVDDLLDGGPDGPGFMHVASMPHAREACRCRAARGRRDMRPLRTRYTSVAVLSTSERPMLAGPIGPVGANRARCTVVG